jgi:hypothetical protein
MGVLDNIKKLVVVLILVSVQFVFMPVSEVHAATSPSLGNASGYSVLGGAAVTNTGITTTNGAVGVSPGSTVTDNGTLTAGGGIHENDASAIAAQASTVTLFGDLDQTCTASYSSGQDLTLLSPLPPGVYCSAGSFLLTGNLTLSGSGVWIFKTVSTLITSPGSSVTGGDPCNVWWRIGSAATLDTTTSFIGTIVTADVADTTAMNTGATLDGRILAQAAATVTLDANTITGPTCTAALSTTALSSAGNSSGYCEPFESVAPIILESRRIDADSVFISWGPYSGIDTFIVEYGTVNGSWLYNTRVTGFSTTLNDLPANTPIWVRVTATDYCSMGVLGQPKLVGGPGLPNAGFAPFGINISWEVPAAGLVLFSILLVLIQRLVRSLPKP